MYPYIHPGMEIMPMCCYCRMNNENATPPMQHMPNMGQEMQDMKENNMKENKVKENNMKENNMKENNMSKNNMSQADRERIQTDTQEIVRMFECHHPELLNTLMCCGASVDQARQYLSRVVSMALMHHMMHQTK
ncbi:hypothetical protein AB8U03_16725 [Clostridium sp. Mt-5]|uniref:Uncharacterized protein n=1 Tax=Clostridium moutaii TaxID=3240932 RepID=A0ABV4BUB3_9CLOT